MIPLQSGQNTYSSAGFTGVVVEGDEQASSGLSLDSLIGLIIGMMGAVVLILVAVVVVTIFMLVGKHLRLESQKPYSSHSAGYCTLFHNPYQVPPVFSFCTTCSVCLL